MFVMDQTSSVRRFSFSAFSPFLAGAIELLASLAFAGWFLRCTTVWTLALWLGARFVWYAVLLLVTRFPPVLSKACHFFSLALFQVGFIALLLITDQSSSFGAVSWGWYAMLVGGTIFPSLSFFAIPHVRSELVFMSRPHTRLGVALMILGLGGIWAAEGAVISFNLYQPAWWWAFVAGASFFSALAAAIGWWWYLRDSLLAICKAAALMMWCMLQIGLVISFWPLGFLFSGLLAVWVWYIIWLTIRYALSDEGITWPRHGYFLGAHALAMLAVLGALIRWR